MPARARLSRGSTARLALLATAGALIAASATIASARAEPPSVAAKRAEARAVLAQIQGLDSRLGQAVEAYDAATVKLGRIRSQLSVNRFEMRVARRNLLSAERRLERRLRELYISGGGDSTIQVLLGATDLDDVINRLDTAARVSAQDSQVLRQVTLFRRQVARRGAALRRAHLAQERVVAERAAAKSDIERGLADRKRLLTSIKDEIARLKAEEAARQALLAARARARLVQQRQIQQARLNASVVGATAQAPSSTGDPNAVTTVAPPSHYGGVVGVAMAQLGKPYVWAAAGPDTFDCSGLVVYAFAQFGVSLPHSTYSLWNLGVYVSRDQLQPGDLVFFDGLGHMGIYIGGGQFIHAPHTGDVVKISNLSESWYASAYVGARRIL